MAINERMDTLFKISKITDEKCKVCTDPLKEQRYCINDCVHGKELRSLGKKLEDIESTLRTEKEGDVSELKPSKENYYFLREKNYTEVEIRKIFKMGAIKYYEAKARWGIPKGKQGGRNKKKDMHISPEDPRKQSIQNVKVIVEKSPKKEKKQQDEDTEEIIKNLKTQINNLEAEVVQLYKSLFEAEDETNRLNERLNKQTETTIQYMRKSAVFEKVVSHLLREQIFLGKVMDPMTELVMEILINSKGGGIHEQSIRRFSSGESNGVDTL